MRKRFAHHDSGRESLKIKDREEIMKQGTECITSRPRDTATRLGRWTLRNSPTHCAKDSSVYRARWELCTCGAVHALRGSSGKRAIGKEEVVERSMKERIFQAEEEACSEAQKPARSYPVWVRPYSWSV